MRWQSIHVMPRRVLASFPEELNLTAYKVCKQYYNCYKSNTSVVSGGINIRETSDHSKPKAKC